MRVKVRKTGVIVASVPIIGPAATNSSRARAQFDYFVKELTAEQRVSFGWVKTFAVNKESRWVWIEPESGMSRKELDHKLLEAFGYQVGLTIHSFQGLAIETRGGRALAMALLEKLEQLGDIAAFNGLLGDTDIAIAPRDGANLAKLKRDIESLASTIN